jgi:hypothetical protein
MVQVDRDRFMDQGFLILRDFIPQERIARLRVAYEAVVDRARAQCVAQRRPDDPPGGAWEYWAQPRPDIGRVPGLLDAATAEAAEFWIDDSLLEVANRLLAVPEASVTELTVMCSPSSRDFGPSDWHRDIGAAEMAPLQRLIDDVVENGPRYIQWNIPLYDDDVLWVIPGSHRRSFGERERTWTGRNLRERQPDAVPVELRAGDAVVYINYIWHWGSRYDRRIRRTIHGGHSCFTTHLGAPFLPALSERALRHFAWGEARAKRAQAATELALRAAMSRDPRAYRAALEAIQPGIGEKGRLLLGIYLDKLADGILHQHRRDVPEEQWQPRYIGGLHPITLKWGRDFAHRFTAEEAEALWTSFAEFDAKLRGSPEDTAAHRQKDYLYEDVPGLVDPSRLWSGSAALATV